MAVGGFVAIQTPDDLYEQDRKRSMAITMPSVRKMDDLAAWVGRRYSVFKDHREKTGLNAKLLHALRAMEGEYSPEQKLAIDEFGGSTVYARITATKCRGASALLRDVFMGPDKPWSLMPTPDPKLPEEIVKAVITQAANEGTQQVMDGTVPQVDVGAVRKRAKELMAAAQVVARDNARAACDYAQRRIDDLLVEGGWYDAMAEILVDLPVFPYVVMKGPVVRIVDDVLWENGSAVVRRVPRMFWSRVSPFDIYWTPGVHRIDNADVIQVCRYTRADLNELIGVPGYDSNVIREILNEYQDGWLRWTDDMTESTRVEHENREPVYENQSGLYDGLEFTGSVQGHRLVEYGLRVPDKDLDYYTQLWIVGDRVIKAQLIPSPRKRHPYFVTAWEKIPGTVAGRAIPEVIDDQQAIANAAIRALANNMGIASGPQVVVDTARLVATANEEIDLHPWKIWTVDSKRSPSGTDPIKFYQPDSRAQELLGIYDKATLAADELSGIPRYTVGSDRASGAGRTASGLAMLNNNASKVLQVVCGNVDLDITVPSLLGLYDMIMLTDTTGMLRGDENVKPMGVVTAVRNEAEDQRLMEFVQMTANPIDQQLLGPIVRIAVLAKAGIKAGLPESLFPDPLELKSKLEAQGAQANAQDPTNPTAQPVDPNAPPQQAAANDGSQPPGPPSPDGKPGDKAGSQPQAPAQIAGPRRDTTAPLPGMTKAA